MQYWRGQQLLRVGDTERGWWTGVDVDSTGVPQGKLALQVGAMTWGHRGGSQLG